MHIELGQAEPSLNWVDVTQLNGGTPIPANYAGSASLIQLQSRYTIDQQARHHARMH